MVDLRTTTHAVEAALGRGALLRSRTAGELDDLERILATGLVDDSSRTPVGEGMNGLLHKVRLADPLDPSSTMWAVEKPAGAQAAQEELGWRLARELGIDHLAAAVARRADGTAYIELRPGRAISIEGITDAAKLEGALRGSYLADSALGLDEAGAASAARADRQLVQAFDYLLANNDRNMSNALWDARSGTLSLIDSGHAGRGTLASNGGTTLVPVLQGLQAGRTGGHVALDDAVVGYLRARTSADRLRELHAATFQRTDVAGPPARSYGERFLPHVRSDSYRDGLVARYEHVLETGGYDHAAYRGDNAGDMPPLVEVPRDVHGFRNVRAAFDAARF
jgi:hypothetical protein